MTGQRDNIEVLRDCINILRDLEDVRISGDQKRAITHYIDETMEAILSPLKP